MLSAAGNMSIETEFQSHDNIKLEVDSDCTNAGTLSIKNYGKIDTSTFDETIVIWGGSFEIDNTSWVYAGDGEVQFSERCSFDQSIGIGGVSDPMETMGISQSELNRISCWDITFDSFIGNMVPFYNCFTS